MLTPGNVCTVGASSFSFLSPSFVGSVKKNSGVQGCRFLNGGFNALYPFPVVLGVARGFKSGLMGFGGGDSRRA